MKKNVVYKYALPQLTSFALELPAGAEIVACGWQEGAVMWALVDPDADTEVVRFRMLGTGWEYDRELQLRHIGTLQTPQGFVWHYFLEKEQ